MKKYLLMTALAAALATRLAPLARAADGSGFVGTFNPGDGLFGSHVYGTDTNARGFVWDYNDSTNPNLGWSFGLERAHGDLYLYNYNTVNSGTITASNNYPLRLRGDTAQLELGPSASLTHPSSPYQLGISAGTATAPLIGLGVGVWGNTGGLYLYQNQTTPLLKRTSINFNNVYLMGTDSPQNNTADWWLWNGGTGHFVMTAGALDGLSINYGATIAGTTTLTGPVQFTNTSTVGFYGTSPQSKPTITGCRSDGSALASLLSKLSAMGLITDQTTP
jgi:hypothetical protein